MIAFTIVTVCGPCGKARVWDFAGLKLPLRPLLKAFVLWSNDEKRCWRRSWRGCDLKVTRELAPGNGGAPALSWACASTHCSHQELLQHLLRKRY